MADRIFSNREEAGRELAARLMDYQGADPIVLALPRGGVPVGVPIARALECPLDLVMVRKIGAPQNPELAIGSVAGSGDRPELFLNQEVIDRLGVPQEHIRRTAADELDVIDRRRRGWLGNRPPLDLTGRTAIVVDDGIATGATFALALQVVRKGGPAKIVLAAPVAPPSTLQALAPYYDEAVCLETPEDFFGVGQFYRDFGQVEDGEVVHLLASLDPVRQAGRDRSAAGR